LPSRAPPDAGVTQWNHNNHYHPILLDAVPPDATRALDIGCGEGLLTRQLARRVPEVVGIDIDRASIDRAKTQPSNPGTKYILGDFLAHPFEPESFGAVMSVAVLHHVDARGGLARMRQLLRAGGILGIIGLARTGPANLPYHLAGRAASFWLGRGRSKHEPISPTLWPPPHSFGEMRRIVEGELPGAQFRRHILWRYSVIWRKPR